MGLSDVPLRVIVGVVVIVLGVVGAYVALTVTGHDGPGYELPVIVGSVLGVLLGQRATHAAVSDANDKLQSLLNGGTENAVRKVVREELTRLVAVDQAAGTVTVATAGRGLASDFPPVTPTAPLTGSGRYDGGSNPDGG